MNSRPAVIVIVTFLPLVLLVLLLADLVILYRLRGSIRSNRRLMAGLRLTALGAALLFAGTLLLLAPILPPLRALGIIGETNTLRVLVTRGVFLFVIGSLTAMVSARNAFSIPWGNLMTQSDSPTRAVLIGIAVLVSLFLGYRGIKYAQCRARCAADCAAQAQAMNPFAAFGGRNDLGRALCEQTKKLCLSGCSYL